MHEKKDLTVSLPSQYLRRQDEESRLDVSGQSVDGGWYLSFEDFLCY